MCQQIVYWPRDGNGSSDSRSPKSESVHRGQHSSRSPSGVNGSKDGLKLPRLFVADTPIDSAGFLSARETTREKYEISLESSYDYNEFWLIFELLWINLSHHTRHLSTSRSSRGSPLHHGPSRISSHQSRNFSNASFDSEEERSMRRPPIHLYQVHACRHTYSMCTGGTQPPQTSLISPTPTTMMP